jgi:hypothetical protein
MLNFLLTLLGSIFIVIQGNPARKVIVTLCKRPLFNKTMSLFDYCTGNFYFRQYRMHP